MARSPLFDRFSRTFRLALDLDRAGLPTDEGLDLARANQEQWSATKRSRRDALKIAGAAAAVGVLGSKAARAVPRADIDVGIVGAGLAGLACADRLQKAGVYATLYDGNDRIGGRCWSLRGVFPGQVAEHGGELVDNLHKTMLGYANAFGLALEDMEKAPGEIAYHFDGALHDEASVVAEFRAFVSKMQADLRASTGAPTADTFNNADLALDRMSLREYLVSRGASRLLQKAIEEAYVAEYGLEPEEQSSLNFLLFMHADKRSRFMPFGVFSDERYHIVGGNDQIPQGIATGLRGQTHLGLKLTAARRTAAGRVELTFKDGNRTVTATHDAVVFALPFSTLRDVALDASLALPAWKTKAIRELGYGWNAKTMVGFTARPWAGRGFSGTSYSDLANHQTTWETNPSHASATNAVITDYAGGNRGRALDPRRTQTQVTAFLGDFDRIFPGAAAAARRDGRGDVVAHLAHWPTNPFAKGSYTAYRLGQFTGIAGNEGKPIGNLFFAGEHTDSFYDWQGFMEGACNSGIRAANELLGR